MEDIVSVSVVLALGGQSFRGEAKGSVASAMRPRIVGEATLRAVEGLTGARFDLAAVGTSSLDDVTIALVQVREEGRSADLVGSAIIRQGDVVLATARAVLDALNRRLATIRLSE